jgi:VCBS repeat-containing protein
MAVQISVKVATQTGAAKDDLFNEGQITEDSLVGSLNVLANDPGSAKLWSVYQDANTLNIASNSNVVTLASGATITINPDGTIKYDATSITKVNLNELSATETFTDSFTYTVRMANGALSVATAKVVVQGTNDAAVIGDATNTSVTEDQSVYNGSLTATGKIAVTDVRNVSTIMRQPEW